MNRPGPIATWARHQVALASLGETLEVLQGAGVPALVVKGMVLAYSLYDDVSARPLSDVDLRVRPRDLVAAVRAMRARGLRPGWSSRQLGAVSFAVGETLVELETSVGPPGLCALTVARMMERSVERVLPGGLRVREPEVHDHAVLLVVNAFKDKLVECPPWSLDDLDSILAHVDTETLLARVAEARARTLTWITADWLARERGSERWRALRERLGPRPPRRLYAWAMRRWMTASPESFRVRWLARAASDSAARRAWALAAGGAGTAVSWLGRRL